MNSYRSTNLSLKYQRFAESGCKDIGIQRFEFVTKNSIPLSPEMIDFYKILKIHEKFN